MLFVLLSAGWINAAKIERMETLTGAWKKHHEASCQMVVAGRYVFTKETCLEVVNKIKREKKNDG